MEGPECRKPAQAGVPEPSGWGDAQSPAPLLPHTFPYVHTLTHIHMGGVGGGGDAQDAPVESHPEF